MTKPLDTADYSKPVEPIIVGDNVIVGYRNIPDTVEKIKLLIKNKI